MGPHCCKEVRPLPQVDEISAASVIQSAVVEPSPRMMHKLVREASGDEQEEARQLEKARLKVMVRDFASEAMQGMSCTAIDLETGETSPAVYYIDRNLKSITLKPISETFRFLELMVSISTIIDVFRDKDLSEHPTLKSMHGVAALSALHRQQLVIVLFTKADGKEGFMGLLQADSKARDAFATSVNILRLYREVLTSDLV